jgi:hypothetical protein
VNPRERRLAIVRAVQRARQAGTAIAFEAVGERVEYEDRLLRFDATADALAPALADYHVFKVKQPETRKAPEGVTYVSAIADAKHLADFLDDAFVRVFDAPEGYDLSVDAPD